MNNSKKYILLVSIVLIILIIGGFFVWYFFIRGSSKKTEKPADTTISSFNPLKLVYSVHGFMGNSEGTITLWIEKKQECDGRQAYLGLMSFNENKNEQASDQNQAIAKITLYEDNGELVITDFTNENELAFNDLEAKNSEFNIFPLTLNTIFAYADQNFNTSEVWTSDTPTVLNDVYTGKEISDYSIVQTSVDSSKVLPCQGFKMITKGTNNATANICVTKDKKINDVNLPFVVYVTIPTMSSGKDSEVGWELESYSSEKSTTTWIPQCLNPVECTPTAQPTNAEQSKCSAQGGQLQQKYDETNCVTGYECLTEDEMVEHDIQNSQRPGCPINPAVKTKLLACRESGSTSWEGVSGKDGCLTDIKCK